MERSTVCHEIHDALLPLIFAASASVSALAASSSDDEVVSVSKQRLLQVSQWLDDALQTGRLLLTAAYPPELTGTLWSRVAIDTVQRLASETETSPVQWNLDAQVDDVSKPIALAAYRIVVEAVRNAERHGDAQEIIVGGELVDRQLRITVDDNGKGFDPTAISDDRYGVRSMIARAELVGGKLEVESKLGSGTKITFSAICPKPQA
ncbi:MAG: sensor histidine kinase [Rubripirellula sp.]